MIIDLISLGAFLLVAGFVVGYARFRRDYVKGYRAGVTAGAAAAAEHTNRSIDLMLDRLGISRLASTQELGELVQK